MPQKFGLRVRTLREQQGITREDFCGDESELSVRQLARIESGKSMPGLEKVSYIANRLGMKIGELTDGENFTIPRRYKEIKYAILRKPLYMDEDRITEREDHFDEIFSQYYDELPEEEQLSIDALQSSFEVYHTGQVDFGINLIPEYFEQLRKKKKYRMNDLILIDLYFTAAAISYFDSSIFQVSDFNYFCKQLLLQRKYLLSEELFFLNNLLQTATTLKLYLKDFDFVPQLLEESNIIMGITEDFQKKSIYYLLQCEYAIFFMKDIDLAKHYYEESLLFAKLFNDKKLQEQLQIEWEKLSKNFR